MELRRNAKMEKQSVLSYLVKPSADGKAEDAQMLLVTG
jgi:hypothetical protein